MVHEFEFFVSIFLHKFFLQSLWNVLKKILPEKRFTVMEQEERYPLRATFFLFHEFTAPPFKGPPPLLLAKANNKEDVGP